MPVHGRATASEARHLKAADAREASTAFLATLDAVGTEIRSRLELADRAMGKAEDHYRAAGLQLIDVKKRIAASGQDGDGASTFEAFLKQHSIGRSRAYDMIAIADGKKTLQGIRAMATERKRLERAKSSDVRDVTDKIAVELDSSDIVAIKAKLKKAEEREKEFKSKLGAQKSLADIASKQRKDALTEAMFLRADIERLTSELEKEKADKTVRAVIEPQPPKDRSVADLIAMADEGDAEQFQRDLEMVRSWSDEYRQRILAALNVDHPFSVAVSAYDALPPDDRLRFHEARPWPALRLVAA